jgi:hypothetical protein
MLGALDVLLGGALLVAGRRLFWLVVGAIGFIIGVEVAIRLFRGSELSTVLAGLVLGAIFALLAVFVESIAIGLVGFLGGGYVGMSLAGLVGLDGNGAAAIAFVIGGVVGVILIAALFEWALITISSLAGASMVVTGLRLGGSGAVTPYVLLVLAGVVIQGLALRRRGVAPRRANQ